MIPFLIGDSKTIRGGIIMKKKLLVAMMSCMLMAGAVTGCGSKEADAPTTAATEAVTEATTEEATDTEAAESEEAATEAEAETTVAEAAAEGSYLAWSGVEWKEADDAEKTAAAREYLLETVKITAEAAGQEFTSEMEASITDEQVATVVDSLEAGFAADESVTIQEMLDAASELMNSMMETEEAAE